MRASCDVARCSKHRVKEQLQESRDQSSKFQVEMREDVERLEANEQVVELKSRLEKVKEAAVASKARSDRQVAQKGGNSHRDEGTAKCLVCPT